MSPASTPETQLDRTRLSWRRTLNGMLAVGGIGAMRLIASGHLLEAALSAIVALAAAIPMYRRQRVLRASNRPARWEPAAVAVGTLLLAATVVFTP